MKARFVLVALVIFSIILAACPPIEEEQYDNTIVVEGSLDREKWDTLIADIHKKGLQVHLDLSACTVPGLGGDILKRVHENGKDYTDDTKINQWDDYIQFDPSLGNEFGKELILSIIVPDVATMIRNASGNIYDIKTMEDVDRETESYAFRHFTRLRSVSGKRISLIGTFAFYNCTTLEEANFPNVIIVMQYAFSNTGLRRVEFEKLRHIQPSAFEGSKFLDRVDLHNVDIIAQRAFMDCTRLRDVSFSNVIKIEPEAFKGCTNLRTARFLANPLRVSSSHPLDPWRADNPIPYTTNTVAFHNNVFRGCTSLEILDVRNAWNVYFGAGALADIGTYLELHLFDDDGARSEGHPQVELLLGGKHPELDIGELTLKELKIIAPTVLPETASQILFADHETLDGYSSIRNRINAMYNPGPRHVEYNEPEEHVIKVTVERRPALH